MFKRVNAIIWLFLSGFYCFPLFVGAAEAENANKPVPAAAQETQATVTNKKPVPVAAQEQTTAKPVAQQKPVKSQVSSQSQTSVDDEIRRLSQEVKILQLEQAKLSLEYERELLKLQQEKEKIVLENELRSAKETHLSAELNATKARLELENALQEQKQAQQQAYIDAERNKLAMQNALQEERNRQRELQFQSERTEFEFKILKFHFERELLEGKIVKRSQTEEWDQQVNKPKEYLKEPFVDGHLIISDRRIVLDDPILQGTADYIVERIQYFNNKDTEYPIFIIIGSCPGGSVMEGTRILKAMENSRAPVYVVVKSFAASMAAVITTLAERSYALPNAVMIHHQPWTFSVGNAVEQRENLKILDEWSKRLMQPVADKMGITIQELVEKMYQHNSLGDWFEFADAATQFKWVDYIVEDIRDTSYTKQPADKEGDDGTFQFMARARHEKIDPQGRRYVKVPRLRPLDVYFLYNPDNYYRY